MFCSRFQLLFALSVLFIGRIVSISVNHFYPYGDEVDDVKFPPMDDGTSPKVSICTLFPFFNNQQDSLYVSSNGIISFQIRITWFTARLFPISDDLHIIAPFWADINTNGNRGTIWYRASTNQTILTRATDEIKLYYPSLMNFCASWVFIATWDRVGFFGANHIGREKRNTFQVVLITDGTYSFVQYNYHAIQWTTATNGGGSSDTGLGGTAAQVGFNAGDGVNYYTLKQSRTAAIQQLPSLSNVGVPGKFVFRIDKENIEQGGCNTQVNPLRKPPTLIRVNPLSWTQNAMVEVDWKEDDIPFNVTNAHLEIYTVEMNVNSQPYLHYYKSLPLTKTFILDINGTGAVLSLSKINQIQLQESVWSDVFYVKPENNLTLKEMCIEWQNQENKLWPVYNLSVQECPCILDQATIDVVRFHEDPNCHVLTTTVSDKNRQHINCVDHLQATTCFRMNVPGPRDTGRLCCYNKNGTLMDAGSSESGGTLHRHHYEGGSGSIPYLSHFQMDVVPYLQCCVYGNPSTCNQYLGLRPKGKCQRYEPIAIGQTAGDPHFTTLDCLEFTFNGIGEFILLKHIDDKFMGQVRMEQLKDVNGALRPASLLTSFAAKSLNSSDTVEVRLNTIRTADVLINGNVVDFTGFDKLDFFGMRISRSNENETEGSFTKIDVVFKDPQIGFRIMAYSNFLNILILTGSENLKGNIDGLMGNNNGIAKDDLGTSNRSSIPANSTTATIHREVGLKWRVNQSASLFTYPNGRSYASYQNEMFTPIFNISTQPSTEALEVCGNDTFCLFDFHTSGGDSRIAAATRTSTDFLQKMKRTMAVKFCEDPKDIPNGYWNATGTIENSTATLICDEGYKSNTTEIIFCSSEGNWTYSGFTSCEVLSCGAPRDIKHGYWNMSGTIVNSTAVMICDDGYTTNMTDNILCNKNGNWTYPGYTVCEVVSCGMPRDVENGFWNITGTIYNSTAVLLCSEGYKSNTMEIFLCNNEGNWTYNGSEGCEVLSCGAPRNIEHGNWNMTGTVVNSTAVMMCDYGYTTNMTDNILCNKNGNWTYPGYTVCEVVSCGMPKDVENGFWNITGTIYNSTAVLLCSEGYKSNTMEIFLCNNEGNWTYNGSEGCEVLSCGFPRDIEHGYWNMTETIVNSTAVMMCYDGYTTNSSDIIIVCNNDGNWAYTGHTVCEVKVTAGPALTLRKMVIGLLVCSSGILLVLFFGYICLRRANGTKDFREWKEAKFS